MVNHTLLSRRQVLRGAGGVAVAGAAASALAACSDEKEQIASNGDRTVTRAPDPTTATTAAPTASTGGSAAGGVLPTYTGFGPAKPDLAGDAAQGVPDAFFAYPAAPPQVHSQPPAGGGDISVLKLVSFAPPAPLNQNQYWQELNKRIGANLQVTSIIASDYVAKVATTVAGGNLPDLMQMSVGYVGNAEEFVTTQCQDLSEWLSGDAAKQFKSLAAIPTQAWKNVVFKKGIYGVPYPLGVVGNDHKVRQDIVDKLGLSTEMSTGQDFLDLCKGLTDVNKQRWALDQINTAMSMVCESVGSPNGWKVENGEFVNQVNTPQYKQALDICSQLWKAECIYPDSVSSTADFLAWFTTGRVVIEHDGFTNWAVRTSLGLADNPDFRMGGIVMPKWDGGGQAAHQQGTGMYTFTVLRKQSSKDRVEELLRVLDWLATPFGSDEYLFSRYGIPDRDYTLQGTDPVQTQTGTNETVNFNVSYIATTPQPLYAPGHPEVVKTDYEYLQRLMKVSEPLPTVGLTSATSLTKGASISKAINGVRNDIIVGRKPLSSWDAAVKAYNSSGGEQIAKEYSEAYAAANS